MDGYVMGYGLGGVSGIGGGTLFTWRKSRKKLGMGFSGTRLLGCMVDGLNEAVGGVLGKPPGPRNCASAGLVSAPVAITATKHAMPDRKKCRNIAGLPSVLLRMCAEGVPIWPLHQMCRGARDRSYFSSTTSTPHSRRGCCSTSWKPAAR